MERVLIGGIGAALLVGLGFLCVMVTAPAIEADLRARTRQALDAQGMGYARVNAEGRDLVLTGIAPGQEENAAAASLSASVWGVRVVENQMVVDPESGAPYSTRITRQEDGALQIEGFYPDKKLKDALVAHLKASCGGCAVADRAAWRPAYLGQDWLGVLKAAGDVLQGFKPGQILFQDGGLRISGEPIDLAAASKARAFLDEALAAPFKGEADFQDPLPYVLVVSRQGHGLLLTGHVPDEAAHKAVLSRAQEIYGQGEVEDQLEARPHDLDERWLAHAIGAVEVMKRFKNGHATLVERQWTLSGEPMDAAAAAAAQAFIDALKPPWSARARFSTLRPLSTRITLEPGRIALTGDAPSAGSRALLVARARQVVAPVGVDSPFEVNDALKVEARAADPRWPLVVAEAIEQLKRFKQGELLVEDYRLTLSGQPLDKDSASLARAFILYGLPRPFEGRASFDAPDPNEARAVFDGRRLILTGDAPDPLWRDKIALSAAQLFGQGNIDDRLTVKARPEDPAWLIVFNRGLTILSSFTEGEAVLSDRTLSVKGTASTPQASASARDGLGILLQRPFVGLASFDVAVSQQPLAPSPLMIDGPTCQARLKALMAGETLSFESDRCQLEKVSAALLVEIGKVMMQCPGERVEIGGHTDSSGNDQANLKLSQLRAVVVRDHLVHLGVPGTRLQATGYGEERPLAGNATTAGRAINRRIEFTVLGE